jgi:hypothetical protein
MVAILLTVRDLRSGRRLSTHAHNTATRINIVDQSADRIGVFAWRAMSHTQGNERET